MNRNMLGIAVLIAGLFFYCTKVEASNDILPKAGFQAWMAEIECEPIFERIEPTYYISDEDADLLVRIGVMEAGEEDIEGIANVIQVVVNRVNSDQFPNTVSEVIFQTNPKQFVSASELASANVTAEAYVALDAVIFGEYQSNDCIYFESLDGKAFASWSDYSFSYGGHDFYK